MVITHGGTLPNSSQKDDFYALIDTATGAAIVNADVSSAAAINITKIAVTNQAAGDILYFNGTAWVRLPKGTAAQILKMNAGATAPEWV